MYNAYIYSSYLIMRQKTDSLADRYDEEKFQLQGWNNDLDDLSSTKNLLKILQKKITFPLLQNHQGKKKHRKLQTLPAVEEYQKKLTDRQKQDKQACQGRAPKITFQKLPQRQAKQEESIEHRIKLKKSKTEKAKLTILQNLKEIKQPEQKKQTKKERKQKKQNDFEKSYLKFFQSIKAHQKKQKVKPVKKLDEMIKNKHQKLASVQLLPLKSKVAVFDEYHEKDSKQKDKEHKKSIRWDRFSLSQQKFALKFDRSKENGHKGNIIQLIQRQKYKMSKQKSQQMSEEKDYTKMFWMQKILEKGKFNIKKIVKTQANDFMDEHLQCPIQCEMSPQKNRDAKNKH